MKKSVYIELIKFAMPVVIGQLGLMLIGAGDVMIATQHSTTALAAIGLAVAFANPVFVVGLAFQFALSPLIAQRRGEKRDTTHLATTSLAYALLLSIPFVILTYLSSLAVPLLKYDAKITEMVMSYIRISAWSMPGVFVYTSLREWLQAHERTWLANAVAIIGVPLNIFLNRALVFGEYGMPALGVDGLAWASFWIRNFLGLSLLIPLIPTMLKRFEVEKEFIFDVIKLGAPSAISMFFEVMAFCSVTIFVGSFGEVQTAANSLVLTLASITFMVPMAIASAVGVKVGHAFGEKNPDMVSRYAWTGLSMSITFMACSALTFALFPRPILSIFGPASDVMEWGVKLIFWVAIFQVFDGSQVTLSAILRGLSISKPVSVVTFIGYWLIGIPLGWILGNKVGMEAQGFWVGLSTSLCLVALSLLILTRKKISDLSV
ncbi:MAG: MATE family efflux transporter [Bacteriovoracaceae bacterium]|nr:MATE family efflux transporter [Bacteriovoracaceae bacterium]